MRFFISNKKQPDDIGAQIESKALKQYELAAMEKVRDFLCTGCIDRKCMTGSVCNAFLLLTKSVAWAMTAGNAELN